MESPVYFVWLFLAVVSLVSKISGAMKNTWDGSELDYSSTTELIPKEEEPLPSSNNLTDTQLLEIFDVPTILVVKFHVHREYIWFKLFSNCLVRHSETRVHSFHRIRKLCSPT